MNDLDLFSEPQGGRQDRPAGRRDQRRLRKKQKNRRRNGRAAVCFALAFLVAIFGTAGVLGFAVLDNRLNPPDYDGAGTGSVTVQITEGASGTVIAAALEEHDVVKSARAFVKVWSGETRSSSIQPGFYQMRAKMSSKAAMAMLLDPKSRAGNQITVPEGRRAVETYELLAKKTGIPVEDFEAAAKNTAELGLPEYADGKVEGYLFPGRYNLDPNGSASDILKQMVARFVDFAESTGLESKAEEADLDPAKVVTLASLVQAEGGKPSDLPKISRVIYNRLEIGMKLQFDTTLLYALGERRLAVTVADTKINHPYNTYMHAGLTPGPISNPGEDAIEAALNPEDGKWLYFVATDPTNKITKFAESYEEHAQNELEFEEWQRRNPGN
ncbi:endolytic transglycosylase MltG [Actinomadura sp. LOL_016]|uniref:endolytic transglycosylase MltG n=1 Tax=unclassified Actinomadura TaxID=2626254 RepID=UPI003A7F9139